MPTSETSLVWSIWPSLYYGALDNASEDYSAFYNLVRLQLAKIHAHPESYSLHSLDDIAKLIRVFRDHPELTRQEVASAIFSIDGRDRSTFGSDDVILRTVEIAIWIWLTLDVRLVRSQARGPFGSVPLYQSNHITWTANVSLKEAIATYFDKQMSTRGARRGARIDLDLTLERLVNEESFSVHWSSNLADHLLVDSASREVTVYEHKICLANHLSVQEPTIPVAVLEEAIDTLNFLLPFEDNATKTFLQKERKHIYGLGRCNRETTLELDRYVYWRSRIEHLLEIVKEPPRGLRQLRPNRTRQDLTQTLNFWVAVAVAILAIVSFVFGVISTVYAKKQYESGMLQYQLALAQACTPPNAATQLPEFCR